MKYRLILASASPRRRELLNQIGAEFDVFPAKGEEHIASAEPKRAAMELSKQKAEEVAENIIRRQGTSGQEAPEAVLGADTMVAFAGQILGKPEDETDAVRMLKLLSGNTHSVFTGVTLVMLKNGKKENVLSFCEETKVTVYPMTEKQILAYVKTGEPMDKAGAYGIQGKFAIYIDKIEGDYNNVVGLPVGAVFQKLEKSGIEIL